MRLSFLFYAGRFRSQLHFNHARARPPARSSPSAFSSFRAAPSSKLNGVMEWRSISNWLSPPMFRTRWTWRTSGFNGSDMSRRFVIPKSFAQCARRTPRQYRGHLCRVGRLRGLGYCMDDYRQRRKCRLVCCAASPDFIAVNHLGGPGIASWIPSRNGTLRSLVPIN